MFDIDRDMKWAIISTWDGIAPDAYEMCEDDNFIAMEMTLDADRLTMNGYGDVQERLRNLYDEHGYQAVWKYLSEKIQLL